MHYTYLHRRLSDGRVFYVGKGSRADRVKSRIGRSERWCRIVAKHGLKTEIVAHWTNEKDAFEHERVLIACSRDMGIELCNHTDGGEGACGFKQSEETKALRNSKLIGLKRTPEQRLRISVGKAGAEVSDLQRMRISATLKGRYVGGLNPQAKAVVCVETGALFGSMTDAAQWLVSLGHKKASFKNIHSAVSGEKLTAYGYKWARA